MEQRTTSRVKAGVTIPPIPGWWSFADIARLFGKHRNGVAHMVFHAQDFGDPERVVGAAGGRTFMVRESAVKRYAQRLGDEWVTKFENMTRTTAPNRPTED